MRGINMGRGFGKPESESIKARALNTPDTSWAHKQRVQNLPKVHKAARQKLQKPVHSEAHDTFRGWERGVYHANRGPLCMGQIALLEMVENFSKGGPQWSID